MPTTLELCEQYFGTRDIYKLMNLTKDAPEKDGMYNSHSIISFVCLFFSPKSHSINARELTYSNQLLSGIGCCFSLQIN